MIELLYSLTELANAVTILVAISTFATVLTVAAPLLQGDRMRSRMKGVIHQRDLRPAKFAVGPGVAIGPCELARQHFHL